MERCRPLSSKLSLSDPAVTTCMRKCCQAFSRGTTGVSACFNTFKSSLRAQASTVNCCKGLFCNCFGCWGGKQLPNSFFWYNLEICFVGKSCFSYFSAGCTKNHVIVSLRRTWFAVLIYRAALFSLPPSFSQMWYVDAKMWRFTHLQV